MGLVGGWNTRNVLSAQQVPNFKNDMTVVDILFWCLQVIAQQKSQKPTCGEVQGPVVGPSDCSFRQGIHELRHCSPNSSGQQSVFIVRCAFTTMLTAEKCPHSFTHIASHQPYYCTSSASLIPSCQQCRNSLLSTRRWTNVLRARGQCSLLSKSR